MPRRSNAKLALPVHLPLEQLEPIDLPLDRPLAPRIAQGSAYRRVITTQAVRKANELGNARLLALFQPVVQARDSAFGDKRVELFEQLLGSADRRTALFQYGKIARFTR
jgi:hypothetical protein